MKILFLICLFNILYNINSIQVCNDIINLTPDEYKIDIVKSTCFLGFIKCDDVEDTISVKSQDKISICRPYEYTVEFKVFQKLISFNVKETNNGEGYGLLEYQSGKIERGTVIILNESKPAIIIRKNKSLNLKPDYNFDNTDYPFKILEEMKKKEYIF
jgi:hypothetical protein